MDLFVIATTGSITGFGMIAMFVYSAVMMDRHGPRLIYLWFLLVPVVFTLAAAYSLNQLR